MALAGIEAQPHRPVIGGQLGDAFTAETEAIGGVEDQASGALAQSLRPPVPVLMKAEARQLCDQRQECALKRRSR